MKPAPAPSVVDERRSALKRLGAFVALAAVFVSLSLLPPVRAWMDPDRLAALAGRLGAWGPVLLLAAGIFMPLLFLPRWPVAFLGGMLYGVVWGGLLANVASLLGAWLHFALSQSLLAPMAARLLRRRNGDALTLPARHVFPALFFLRAFPLSSFVVTNLLAGSLRIPVRTYLAATFLGMIPSTLMYAAGGKLMKQPSKGFYLLIAVTLAVVVAGTWLARRKLGAWRREEPRETPP